MCEPIPSVTLYGTTQLTFGGEVTTSVMPVKTLYSACSSSDTATDTLRPTRITPTSSDPAALSSSTANNPVSSSESVSRTTARSVSSASSTPQSSSSDVWQWSSSPTTKAVPSVPSSSVSDTLSGGAAYHPPSTLIPTTSPLIGPSSTSASQSFFPLSGISTLNSPRPGNAPPPQSHSTTTTKYVAVGATVGSLLVLAVGASIFLCIRRRRRQKSVKAFEQRQSHSDPWERHFQELEAGGEATMTTGTEGTEKPFGSSSAALLHRPNRLHLSLNLLSDHLSSRTRMSALSGKLSSRISSKPAPPTTIQMNDRSLPPSAAAAGSLHSTAPIFLQTNVPLYPSPGVATGSDERLRTWYADPEPGSEDTSASDISPSVRTFGHDAVVSPVFDAQEITVEPYGQPLQPTRLLPPPRSRNRRTERGLP